MSRSRSVLSLVSILVFGAAGARAQAAPTVPQAPAGKPSKTWEKPMVDAMKPKPAGVNFDVSITESPVAAANATEFARAVGAAGDRMVEGRGNRSPGSSAWSITWQWEQETHLGRCQFKDVRVRVTYTTDVAELAGPAATDSASLAWWTTYADRRYATSIDQLKLMRDAAKDIYQRMKLMSKNACSELSTQATELGRERLFVLRDEMTRTLGVRMGPIADPIRPPQD